nr:glutathione S-transferase A-like [Nerophis lumbriciformis]
MAKDMTLFWGAGSPPCWRVLITLEEKKLQGYTSHLLRFDKMEHKSQKVLDINPRGQLPTFKHGDKILNESYAACLYLEDQFKAQGTKLIPECPAERAKMYQRMFEGVPLGQKLGEVIYYEWKVPEAERHDSAVTRNRKALSDEIKLWEKYLQEGPGPFLSGKTFSMADVLVFPGIAYAFHYGLCPKSYPKLAEYYNNLKARKSIKDTWPSTWEEGKETKLKGI